MQIISGDGNSFAAGVTWDNRLKVSSISMTKEHETNHTHGLCYSAGITIAPSGSGDCFYYLKNNSETELIISEFMFRAASDETIYFKLGDSGTPVGGTERSPVNRNAGSGNTADVTFLTGSDITGLSGGSTVMSFFCKGGETSKHFEPRSTFIIPRNKIFTGYVMTGGISINVGVGISFHSLGE